MNKNITKIPFRPQNLLTVSGFVSYCSDNGISISKSILEELHKGGLLYPAIKVYRGTVKLEKIYANFQDKKEWRFVESRDVKKFKPTRMAKEKRYISGGFHIGQEDWLDLYIKRKMVEYPVSQRFTPWDKKIFQYFTDDIEKVENCYELFYEKFQLIALKIIIGKMRIWKILNESQKEKSKKWIKKELIKLYNFLEFYIEIEDLYNKSVNLKYKKIKEYDKKYNLTKKQKKEWLKKDFHDYYIPKLKTDAQNLLKKYKIKLTTIKEWRYLIAQQNIFHESPRSSSCIKTYLKGIDEKFLIKAEDVNYIIYIINFLINLLKNENLTVNQIIGNIHVKYCPICGHPFNPKRKGQITCGDPYCVNENKNKLKKQKRRLHNT